MSKRVLDMDSKPTMVSGDQFHIIDSQDANLDSKDKRVDLANVPLASSTHAPTHHTGGSDELTPVSIGAEPAIGAKGTAFNKDFGVVAGTSAQGNDTRLSDARAPTAHASTHATGQSDAITPASIGAEVAGAADTAVTAHDGTASAHGANIPTTSQKAALDASPTASGANRYVTEADLGSGSTDELVGVSATDTTPDFLQPKLTSGDASVSITRINAGGNEQLDIRSTGAGGGEANTGENLGLGAQVYAQMNGTVLQFRSAIDSSTIEWTQGVDELSASVPANTFDAFGAAATVDSALTTHKSSGDHDARYLQTETDPVFAASPAAAVKDNGVATEYLNGTGAYSTPSAGGGWVDGAVVNDWIDGKQDVDGSAVQTIPMSSGQTIFLDLGASSQTINFTGPDPTANQAITFKAILDNASGMTATFTYNTNALTLKTEGADYGAAATHSLLFIRTSTQFIVETGGKLVVA